jgi:hypothetical protein
MNKVNRRVFVRSPCMMPFNTYLLQTAPPHLAITKNNSEPSPFDEGLALCLPYILPLKMVNHGIRDRDRRLRILAGD